MMNVQILLKCSLVALPLMVVLAFRPAGQPNAIEEKRMPDLVVSAIQFPEGFRVGSCSDIKVAITNKGREKASSFNVGLSCDFANQYIKIGELAVRRTTWITFEDVRVPTKRLVKVEVTADSNNHISELRESNNRKVMYSRPSGGRRRSPSLHTLDRRN